MSERDRTFGAQAQAARLDPLRHYRSCTWLWGKGVPCNGFQRIRHASELHSHKTVRAVVLDAARRCWIGWPLITLCGRSCIRTEEMDLSPFVGAYRADGHSRPAYDPSQ